MNKKIVQEIEQIRKSAGVPYLDVSFSQKGKETFRCVLGDNATGKERLRMYSCSKPVTTVVAMRLVEEGKLGLDDEVQTYLPEIANCFLLDEQGNKVPLKRKMTVRHLFTMTAGFTYDVHAEPIKKLVASNPNATLKDAIGAFVLSPLSFEPGERFQYSLCHYVLAAVVERVEGKRFSQVVKERIFEPLNMCNSTFDNNAGNVARLYEAYADGSIKETENKNLLLLSPAYESGGAGMVSTVDDYVKFAQTLAMGGTAINGKQIIGIEALATLAREQIGEVSVNNGFTCVQGDDYGYGLGVRVRKKATDWGLCAGEYGWDGAAGSYVMIDPEKQISVVIGMHVMTWPHVFRDKHLQIVRVLYENL